MDDNSPLTKQLLFFLVPLSFSMGVLTGCGKIPTKNLVNEALSLAEAGGEKNWQKACDKLEICIERGLTNPNLFSLYSLCLDQIGDRNRAMEIGLTALKKDPDSFPLNYFIGKMYHRNKDFRTAFNHFSKCHHQRPTHIDTIFLMLSCAERLNPTLAINFYFKLKRMNGLGDSYLLYNGLGVCYTQKGELNQAMSTFSQALKLSNGHPLVYLNMAILCDQYMKKPKIAKQYYLEYLNKIGDNFPKKKEKVVKRLKKIDKL